MTVSANALTALGRRRIAPVQWNRDGYNGLDVHACADVPDFDDGMIRRALLSSTLLCESVDGLSHAINRQLWAIGYVASVQPDPFAGSVAVKVSKLR